MAENQPKIILDGDISPLRQKLREAGRDLQQFGAEGKSAVEGIGGPLKALQDKFIAVGAVLAGGAVFKAAVQEAANFTEESLKLGNALGISATEASTFIAALADIDVSQEEFVGAAKGMLKELKNNEAGLQAMGLKTRDAAGNLRPLNDLLVDGIDIVNGYKAGTDRAIAGVAMFGKSFDINGNLIKLNSETLKENQALQESLGALVGQENVEAFKAYDQAMDQSTLTMKAAQTTVGNALMPALTKLAEWFVSIGPGAIVVIKGAIGGLIAAFWALKNGVTVVWETINAMVVTVAEPLRALAAALFKIGTGDFKGAWAEFGKAGQTMTNAWKGALREMETSSRETRDKIYNLFAKGTAIGDPSGAGKSARDLVKEGGKTKKAKTTDKGMTDAEWEMEVMAWEARTATALANERAAAEEAAYDRAVKAAEEWEADTSRANAAVAASTRKSAEQRLQIELLRADGVRDADMARIDDLAMLAQMELDAGQITQAEYLARLEQFNLARLATEQVYLDRKREISLQDPEQNPVELERIELEKAEIRRRYATQGLEIQRQQAIESRSIWASLGDSINGLWDKGMQALLNGTLTWRNGLRAIGAEVANWFATQVVGSQIKAWLAGHARMLAVKLGFVAQEKAIQIAGSASTVGIKTAETTAVAGANAVQAGTGAAASQASIPIVGPILALAAMAAIFAAVSAMGKRKSAMGGYDIPRGLNPMVQTHEEEMILPKQYANVIRGLAGGQSEGGESASIQPLVVNISATDSRSVRDLFLNNQEALVNALRNAHRNGMR
jgi:hypothetical protein